MRNHDNYGGFECGNHNTFKKLDTIISK